MRDDPGRTAEGIGDGRNRDAPGHGNTGYSGYSAFAVAIAVLIALLSGTVLLGWKLGVARMKSGIPGSVAVNPAAAVSFVLVALSLWILARRLQANRTGLATAAAVVGIGASRLAAILSGWDLGIDRILFRSSLDVAGSIPNRMSPNAAAAFVLVGVSLLLLHGGRWFRFGQSLALAAGWIGLLTVIGYGFGVMSLSQVHSYIPMALPTGIGFLLLGAGIFLARPRDGYAAIVTAEGVGGTLSRRFIPIAILLPVVAGFLRAEGERRGLYSTDFGVALMVITMITLLLVMIVWTARFLDQTQAERHRRQALLLQGARRLEAVLDNAPVVVSLKDSHDRFLFVNRLFETVFDVQRADVIGRTIGETRPLMSREFELATEDATHSRFGERENVLVQQDGLHTYISTSFRLPNGADGEDEVGFISTDITARKSAEEEIQRFFEVSLDMLCVAAFDGYFKRLNAAWELVLGFTRAQLMEKPFIDFVHPDDRDATIAIASGLSTGQSAISFTNRYRCSDGSYRWFLWNAGSDLALGRIFAAATDITDLRLAQEQVENLNRELEARVQELGAANRFAVFGSEVGAALTRNDSLDGSLERCAKAMVEQLGASIASIWVMNEKKSMLDLAGSAGAVLPSFQNQVPLGQHRLGRIALEGKPQLVALDREPGIDGDKSWASERGMVSFAGYPLVILGRTVGVIAMFADHDLTEASMRALASVADQIAVAIDRARTVKALGKSESRTRAILDNMLAGLITTDARSMIQTANPAAERMFGYGPGELEGQHLSILIPLGEAEDLRAWLREAAGKALGQVTEWKARRRDGSTFDMELALFPFETSDGWHFAGNIADISQRREIDRMKNEFVSTVSHELRTPLTSIRGSLGLLAAGVLGELPDEAREIIAVAERNVVRLVTLINDILDLDRLSSGRLEMHFSRVPVSRVVGQALESVKAFAEQHGITIECTTTAGTLYADPDRLNQVLVNLLSNAVKFSPRESAISLSVSELKGTTEIRVQDRGRGVPLELRGAIFERFRQVEASDAREKGGTGLGLAICKAIIEQHGGTIGVESGEGGGSVFWIRLLAPVSRATVSSGDSTIAARATVLLVEDDPTLVAVISRQLKSKMVSVRVAPTGQSALVEVRERPPDLIVLDVDVPGGDGYFIVEELRKDPASLLPLLVYSGSDLDAKERERLILGPTRFLTKSRSTDREFIEVVLEMLASSHEKEMLAT